MNLDLVEEIRSVTFTPVRLREGYTMLEVDQFLDRLEEAVVAGRPVHELVDHATFTPVRLREGYDCGEVDTFLDRIVTEMEARSSGPAAQESQPDPAAHPGPHPPYPISTPADSVIAEQRGFFQRLLGRNR